MRQTYAATITFLERKRYNKLVGLPYSYIELKDVTTEDGNIVTRYAQIKYSQALHSLNLKRGDRITFVAEVDTEVLKQRVSRIFVRPGKYNLAACDTAS